MNRRDPHRSAGPRLAALLAAGLVGMLALAGCGPGSGGSGLPDGALGTVPPPSGSPPPSSESPSAPAACPGATGESLVPYAGSIRAVEAGCLLVGERWIVLEGARIERRSGGSATLGELVIGIAVTVTPRSDDPSRALVVLIEDAG